MCLPEHFVLLNLFKKSAPFIRKLPLYILDRESQFPTYFPCTGLENFLLYKRKIIFQQYACFFPSTERNIPCLNIVYISASYMFLSFMKFIFNTSQNILLPVVQQKSNKNVCFHETTSRFSEKKILFHLPSSNDLLQRF